MATASNPDGNLPQPDAGNSRPECTSAETLCDSTGVEPTVNSSHCGSCDALCPLGEFYFDSSCSFSCGDSTVDSGEECDDGNLVSKDGCDDLCQFGSDRFETDNSASSAGTRAMDAPAVVGHTIAPAGAEDLESTTYSSAAARARLEAPMA